MYSGVRAWQCVKSAKKRTLTVSRFVYIYMYIHTYIHRYIYIYIYRDYKGILLPLTINSGPESGLAVPAVAVRADAAANVQGTEPGGRFG